MAGQRPSAGEDARRALKQTSNRLCPTCAFTQILRVIVGASATSRPRLRSDIIQSFAKCFRPDMIFLR